MQKNSWNVVVTRPEDRAGKFSYLLASAGMCVIHAPTIRIERAELNDTLRGVFEDLERGKYGWIVFTSRSGVEAFAALRVEWKDQSALPEGVRIAVQGSVTAGRVKAVFGRSPALVPSKSVAEVLLAELGSQGIKGSEILLALAEETRDVIAPGLAEMGALVEKISVYRTLPAVPSSETLHRLLAVDPRSLVFTFLSPSAFKNMAACLRDSEYLLEKARIVTLGPVTSKAVQVAGYRVAAEARIQTDEGIVEAVLAATRK